eukprot:1215582-Amorphochlora_amoeboformis.AAC.2
MPIGRLIHKRPGRVESRETRPPWNAVPLNRSGHSGQNKIYIGDVASRSKPGVNEEYALPASLCMRAGSIGGVEDL